MECTGVPDIITRVPIVERRKQKCQIQRRCDKGSRGKGGVRAEAQSGDMHLLTLLMEERAMSQRNRQLLAAGKGKETNRFPPRPTRRNATLPTS